MWPRPSRLSSSQTFRERLLDATPNDLRDVAARYLAEGAGVPRSECIVGSAAAVGVDRADGWDLLGPDLKPLGGGDDAP